MPTISLKTKNNLKLDRFVSIEQKAAAIHLDVAALLFNRFFLDTFPNSVALRNAMINRISQFISSWFNQTAPATGIGLFRFFVGFLTFLEICFLLYFRHLIFDPVPYVDVEYPMIPFFLCTWAAVALALMFGLHCQSTSLLNYAFWVIFTQFTPMQRDFDGGFDQFMTGVALMLCCLPIGRAFALDNLRLRWHGRYDAFADDPDYQRVPIWTYHFPTLILLGLLYFDSAVHKLFAPHWREGLGAWLPSSLPYYISAVDLAWWLDIEWLQKTIGYTILLFQFTFIFLFYQPRFRAIYFGAGIALHLGITISFNIYPFGLGMLICYFLVAPLHWWETLAAWRRNQAPRLTVFYDEDCPLCNRTVIFIHHFDVFNRIAFKGLQTHADRYPALSGIDRQALLIDLYALSDHHRLFHGVDTYVQILLTMGYTAPLSYCLRLPGIYHLAQSLYRRIADNRQRHPCDATCLPATSSHTRLASMTRFDQIEALTRRTPNRVIRRTAKILFLIFLLQLNSTVHYGIVYHLQRDWLVAHATHPVVTVSNAMLMLTTAFLGITPHALYMHDHFAGYHRILALTYLDRDGQERWLPFVNAQGRLVAPNWGRVHSMWANVAVTPHIDNYRLYKAITKVTAFWGSQLGLDLRHAEFRIKMKKVDVPMTWQAGLREKNLSGDWVEIGQARWREKNIEIILPKNLNLL